MKQYGLAIESWHPTHKYEVIMWLRHNFGPGGNGGKDCTRCWGEEFDYGLENLYMDEDVYIMYKLRWL